MRFVLEDRLGSERPSVIGVTDNAKGHAARELFAEFRGGTRIIAWRRKSDEPPLTDKTENGMNHYACDFH
jgi:hypothetical protein